MLNRYFPHLACLAASTLLPSCGNLGSHSLNIRLQVTVDSTAIRIHNPTRATYFRTQVEANDAFAAYLGTILPGAHYRLDLDSLRSDQGQRLPLGVPLDRLTCYAQDSAGNFGVLLQDPIPPR